MVNVKESSSQVYDEEYYDEEYEMREENPTQKLHDVYKNDEDDTSMRLKCLLINIPYLVVSWILELIVIFSTMKPGCRYQLPSFSLTPASTLINGISGSTTATHQ